MGRKVVTSERVFETCWIKYCWVNNEYFLGFDDYLTATFVDCNNPCESWRRKSKEQKTQSHKCLKDLTRYNFQGWNDNDDLKRRQKNDANDGEKTSPKINYTWTPRVETRVHSDATTVTTTTTPTSPTRLPTSEEPKNPPVPSMTSLVSTFDAMPSRGKMPRVSHEIRKWMGPGASEWRLQQNCFGLRHRGSRIISSRSVSLELSLWT